MRRPASWGAALLLVLAVGSGSPALASGLGAPSVGTGWSGVTTADPAAVHWNPSMLADLNGFHLQLTGSLVYARIAYQRERRAMYQREDGFTFAEPIAQEDLDPSKTGKADTAYANTLLPAGGLFASFSPIDDVLTIGLGIYPAFAAPIQLSDDGPQRWQLQEAFILGLFITPAIAWKINEWVQVGVGFNVVVGGLALRLTTDLAGTPLLADALANDPINQPNDFGDDAPPGVRELDVLSRDTTINGALAYGFSFNAGVTFTPHEDVRLAVAYQYEVDLTFVGDAYLDMDHDFFTKDLAFQGLEYPSLVKGKAYVELPFPMALRAGVSWRVVPELTIHLQGSWVRWSMVDALRVTIESDDLAQEELGLGPVAKITLPRRWMDTVETEALFEIQAQEDMRVGVRVGYHSPASPDDTVDLTSIDGHRLIGGLVGSYDASENITLTIQALVQQLVPRHVEASDNDRGNGDYLLTILSVGGALEGHW